MITTTLVRHPSFDPSNSNSNPLKSSQSNDIIHHHHHHLQNNLHLNPSPPRLQTPDLGSPFINDDSKIIPNQAPLISPSIHHPALVKTPPMNDPLEPSISTPITSHHHHGRNRNLVMIKSIETYQSNSSNQSTIIKDKENDHLKNQIISNSPLNAKLNHPKTIVNPNLSISANPSNLSNQSSINPPIQSDSKIPLSLTPLTLNLAKNLNSYSPSSPIISNPSNNLSLTPLDIISNEKDSISSTNLNLQDHHVNSNDSPNSSPRMISPIIQNDHSHLPQQFPQSSLLNQEIISLSPPSSPSLLSMQMTPAQKIAREVRHSFSLSKPPISTFQSNHKTESHHDPSKSSINDSVKLNPIDLPPKNHHHDPSSNNIIINSNQNNNIIKNSNQNINIGSSPNNQLPIDSTTQSSNSFQVISGRKGLPDDGKANTAIIRPAIEHSNDSDRTSSIEPKIIKKLSRLGLANQPSSTPLESGHSNPNPTTQPPVPANTSSIPISDTTVPIAECISPLSVSTPPIIPLAVFPTYQQDDDSTSLLFSDGPEQAEFDDDAESDEEEDYDSNPLYIVLSTSLSPKLKFAYDSAKLVLLPTRRALPLDMPRKLPDPTIEFESEWEQWIAAHTFVCANESRDSLSNDSTNQDHNKDNFEWVGITTMNDRRVNLYLKPGSGIAEVRLTYNQPCSSLGTPINSTSILPAKVEITNSTDLPSTPSTYPKAPSRVASEQNVTTKSSKSSTVTNSDPVFLPSIVTDSSAINTQSSSIISRTSSEAWSDMPPTPPNLPCSINFQPHSTNSKTNSICNANQTETFSNQTSESKSDPSLHQSLKSTASHVSTITKVQTARITSEETMYRSPSSSQPTSQQSSLPRGPVDQIANETNSTVTGTLESALFGSKAKKGKEVVEQRLRFKAPKWLRPGAAQKEKEKERREKAAALAAARMREERDRELSLMTKSGPKLEKVRLISLKGPVIDCWWQQQDGQELSGCLNEQDEAQKQSSEKSQGANGKTNQSGGEGSPAGVVPFPRARTLTIGSGSAERRGINRSSISLSKGSTHSSSYHHQLIMRRSSSINTVDDDRSSHQSGSRADSAKRRSRRILSGLSILKNGGTNKYRSLLEDLSFFLSPPEEFGTVVCGILRKSVSKVWMKCHKFSETVVFFKGFENFMVSQLKNELFKPVLEEIQQDLKRYGHDIVGSWTIEDWERFSSLIENVFFAFLHSSLYSRGISCHYASEDDYLDNILHNYRKRHIPLSEFEIELPKALQDESLLTEAVEKLNQLKPFDSAQTGTSSLSPEILQRLFVAMDTVDEQSVLNVLMAKTPYECISIIKQTIDILVSVCNEVLIHAGVGQDAQRLTPDDLLALLASVIVRSGVQQQHSLIHYTKVFRLSNSLLSPETDWAFVSYQAAIAYLQSDPFSTLDSQSIRSQAISVSSMPNSPSLVAGWTRRRPASFTPPTTSGNTVTISARSPSSGLRLSLTEHTQPGLSFRYSSNSRATTSSLQPRHRARGNLSSRSHHLSSTLALADTPEIRLELTSSNHEHSRSVDCLRIGDDGHKLSSGKSVPIRPTLAPINTTDRGSRRILEAGMLSAPMVDSSCGRSCSSSWDPTRSLSSIGEIVSDVPGPVPLSQSVNSDFQSMKASLQDSKIFNRSSVSLFSNDQFGGLHFTGENVEVDAPTLSRRQTVDWTSANATKANSIDLAEEDSNISCQTLRAGQKTVRASAHFHSSLSMKDATERGDLTIRRSKTGSSLGASEEIKRSSSQTQSQTTEGWFEWGRKRLTSVTSLNLVGGSTVQQDLTRHHESTTRRGSMSSTILTGGTRKMLKTDNHEDDSNPFTSQFASSLASKVSNDIDQRGSAMSPAMEALNRARTNPSVFHYHAIDQINESKFESGNPSQSLIDKVTIGSDGMIPLRPIKSSSNYLLNHNHNNTSQWSRSSSSLHI
ncbi:hypothetical protein O181_023138 [Austropuccinia psidii MF-1]|uniref:VPS9 domain-containing protein n=1 Tax=Austropuccinia psidii MF-1 TaxID=1389203 RepID=A0A9Q3CGH8_9BASI|nr:hypothetical protein [Austropuccinia psidii MF-1]